MKVSLGQGDIARVILRTSFLLILFANDCSLMSGKSYEDIDFGSLVLYEDNHLIIVNKPVGMLSQMDKTGDKSIIELGAQYIKVKYEKPGAVFIRAVQRLDRPVSGCIILTRTSKATERMTKIIRERKIKKIYHALSTSKPPKAGDQLIHHLMKDTTKNKVSVHIRPQDGTKEAILNYKLISQKDDLNLLEIDLETGRPHQIRAQLSHIGCPVIGDFKYGDKSRQKDKSICLHSRETRFIHPVRKTEILVTAPYPENPSWKLFGKTI